MASDLRIRFLADFDATRGGDRIGGLDSERLQQLLAYLVLHRSASQPRQRIAFLFWPDSTEGQALTNLRQLLHLLRRVLPETERLVEIERRTLRWASGAPARVDVIELEEAWRRSARATSSDQHEQAIRWARLAAERYRGDLLPAHYAPWVEAHRDRLRALTWEGLERLVGSLEGRREYSAAQWYARRLLELDPLREAAHRAVIRLHALAGDGAAAIRAYRDCANLLSEELGVEPAPATQVLHEGILRARASARTPGKGSEATNPPGLPLVGRHGEWEELRAAWERVLEGESCFMVIRGEAGIGKTRLAETFADWAECQGVPTARARSWEAEGCLPFAPVADWIRSPALADRARRLDESWREGVARVAPDLMGTAPSPPAPEGSVDGWRRLRLFESLARVLLLDDRPLLLVLDDLQWCDADTLQWLHYLLRHAPDSPLFVLTTVRTGEPGSEPRFMSWLLQLGQMESFREIALGPLEAEDTARLGASVLGRALTGTEGDGLYGESRGNPLFALEILHSREAGAPEVSDGYVHGGVDLPRRVRWMIRGRLQRLSPPARDLVPLFATVGRSFTLDALRRMVSPTQGDLAGVVDELVNRHVLREHPDGTLDFTHDKIREVAYEQVPAASRSLLHERVARALEEAHSVSPEMSAGEIARHLEQAGLGEEAISWRRRAGARALALHAYAEAAEHLERALATLDETATAPGRLEEELELRTALGVPLVALDHYSGPRVWATYTRARELCERLGRPASPPILRALALAGLMRSRLPEVMVRGRELMEAAQRMDDPMLRVEAHYVQGVVHYWEGDPASAREHLARALDDYRSERAHVHLSLFAQDPSVVCGVRIALAEWHQGEEEAAHRRCQRVLTRAQELNHPVSLAYARCFGTWVLIECGDLSAARSTTAALIREAPDHGEAVWSTWGGIAEGYLMAEAGNVAGGLRRLRSASERYAKMELSLGFPYHQTLLARALALGGEIDEALDAVGKGLAMAARTGQRFWDAELERFRGELLQKRGAPAHKVRASFECALATARRQGARALEKRVSRRMESW